ncbi:MAG: efflux RND transporter periplasmic adaptor subunit [Burkholderiaceae bacterium]
MKKINWKAAALLAAALLAAGGGAWWWAQRNGADAVQYRTGKIERGPLQATVSASGAVNPVTQVSVGTQVSGQIKELYVDFNSEVKAGQLIAMLDPETFEYRVRQAQADVDAAQAAVLTAQANVVASRAAVSRAKVDLEEARRDHERKASLVEKQFIAQSEGDKARALVNTSIEALKAAEAQLGVTQAQVKSAQANVAQREAALAQARIDLARTRITSPVSGIVIKRAIEKGQTVAASLQAPELFVIAQNLQDMQVDASIDESDVGRIRTGQKASFTVDAFPGQTFEGTVSQVRKAAQNVASVVTYVAVVQFANAGGRLLPGMTANVRVVTDTRGSVFKVPNAALRVRIAGVEPAAAAPAVPDAAKNVASPDSSTGAGGSKSSEKPVSTAAAPAGPASEFRNRLLGELALTPAQLEKVDAIYAEARPRFAQLRELADEERPKARERITADIRARIGELLTPEQQAKYAVLVAEAASRQSTRGRIFLLGEDGKPKAFNVRLGITDGSSTELIVGPNSPDALALKEGAAVIVGTVAGTGGAPQRPPTFGPRPLF